MAIRKILISLFLIMFCAGCAKPDDRTVVQFASWGSRSEVEIIKPVLAEFEAQNPDIKVDFMHIAQNYFQKIHLLFASNTAPDVIFINNLYLPVYANAGVLSPLSPREGRSIPRDGVRGQFYPQALDALTWQGELYAIPRDVSNMVIYYNKDLFDRKHVPYPRDGWTFEEFLQTAQKLTDRPQTFGVSFEEAAIYWLPFVMSSGETFPSPLAGEGLGVGGINFYADLRKKHHVAPMKNESASATMAQMFLQGRLGMHLSGRWLVPKYREEADFNWDVAPFPRGKAGSIVPADASGWAIAKSTKHPQKAMRLVEFLSSYDSIAKFTESGLIVPARIDAANSKYFLDNKPPHNAKAFLNAIQTSKPTPVTVNYNEVLDKLKKDLEPLFN